MNYIKSLHIEGFKKFTSLDVAFNEHMNILVGENEAGKSTILDAIKTVLNQQYRNADKSILRDLFNTQMVAAFKAEPSVRGRCLESISRWNWHLILSKKMLLTFMEKFMGRKSSRLRNSAFDSNVSMMRSLAPAWNNPFRKVRFRMNTIH